MIGNFELLRLKKHIDSLLVLVEKKQEIYDLIMGSDHSEVISFGDERFFKLLENEAYRKLKEDICKFIFELPKEDLYNLYIAFSIGRLGVSKKNLYDEYELQLNKAKQLCEDKFYLEDKFAHMEYDYLKKYLIKGLNYLLKAKDV